MRKMIIKQNMSAVMRLMWLDRENDGSKREANSIVLRHFGLTVRTHAEYTSVRSQNVIVAAHTHKLHKLSDELAATGR